MGQIHPGSNNGYIDTSGIEQDFGDVVHRRILLSRPRRKHNATKAINSA
jgi:hypothetical protein